MLYLLFILFLLIILVFAIHFKNGLFRLKMRLYLAALKRKNEKDDIHKLLILHKKTVLKLSKQQLISILNQKMQYFELLKVLDLKMNDCGKLPIICNIIFGKDAKLLIFRDNLRLIYKGQLYIGKLTFDGKFKGESHSQNQSKIFYESGGKIFSAKIYVQNDKIFIEGGGVFGLPFISKGDKLSVECGEVHQYFSSVQGFLTDKDSVLTEFNKAAKCALYQDSVKFESLKFTKVFNFTLKNHFGIQYKILSGSELSNASISFLNAFYEFGYNIIYNYQGTGTIKLSKTKVIVCKVAKAFELPKTTVNFTQSQYCERLYLENFEFAKAYQTLSENYFYNLNSAQTDSFKLLLLSLSADEKLAELLLYRALKNQTIDGIFTNYADIKYSIIDRNDCFSMLFPVFLYCNLKKHSNYTFLNKRLKYSLVQPLKKDYAVIFGRTQRVYPADSIYEHTVKCLELLEFDNGLPKLNRKAHIAGLSIGGKSGALISALIYLLAVKCMDKFFSQSHYSKFIGFGKTLAQKVKENLSVGMTDINVGDRLIINCLAQAVFNDRQFLDSYSFESFFDLFEYFAKSNGGEKLLDTRLVIIFILGNILEENYDGAYSYLNALCEIPFENGLIGNKIGFGDKFYFCGGVCEYLSILTYTLIREFLIGVRADGKIKLLNLYDGLSGKRVDIDGDSGKISLYFKKSGKNKVQSGGGLINLSEPDIKKAGGSVTVEF